MSGNPYAIKNPVLGDLGNLTGSEFFAKAIPAAVGMAFVIGVLIFLFMLIIGAIQWISSGGDKDNLAAARGKISSALVGIVILFATFAIIQLIENFFHIKILTLDIGPLVIQ